MIEILQHSCTRTFSKFSECSKCGNSCPKNAIAFSNGIPKISEKECIECGACLGVCPTDAIKLEKFSPVEKIFEFLESGENRLNCKKNIPCLASFSSQNLSSLILLSQKDLELDFSHCGSCEIFERVEKQIIDSMEETNFLLEVFGRPHRLIPIAEEKGESSKLSSQKRALLKGKVLSSRFDEVSSEDSQKIRNREIPKSRKLFLFATRELDKKNQNILSNEDLSFLSQKRVSDSCTNCQICYRLCPTHALQSDYKNSFIDFSLNLCLKCGLCQDVCEVNAIQTVETFSISDFLNSKTERLINFDIQKCRECGAFFTRKESEELCHRCEIEEREAHELWGF
jgi:energy-converting hydrogenase A subunit P